MKTYKILIICIVLTLALTSYAQEAPEVTNVECRQLPYPSTLVEITYDVNAETETVHIQLLISDDGGETWDVSARAVEGDIGPDIEIGNNKRILWDAGYNYPENFNEHMQVRIIASDRNPGQEQHFELANGVDIVMCWIPPGSFEMGSPDQEEGRGGNEGPVHVVTFAEGFWIGKYEITQGQWEAVMHNNPGEAEFGNRYGVGDNFPVYYVSWNDIQQFEQRINDGFRLPSESEWEYASRAGSLTRYYWGHDFDANYAWIDANAGGTREVGTRQPNAWGLYDMAGNVHEWCDDIMHVNYNGAPDDGSAWIAGGDGRYRMVRGGSWRMNSNYCRSAHRYGYHSPDNPTNYLGFRLVFSG